MWQLARPHPRMSYNALGAKSVNFRMTIDYAKQHPITQSDTLSISAQYQLQLLHFLFQPAYQFQLYSGKYCGMLPDKTKALTTFQVETK